MSWTERASRDLTVLDGHLVEAARALRAGYRLDWSGDAARAFGQSLAGEMSMLAVLVESIPQARRAVLLHTQAADRALEDARSGR